MDHAEVLERLESAMAAPGKLRGLDADHSLEGVELRHHLETCESCAREYRAWTTASRALDAATPETLRAPAEARSRILAAVTASPPGTREAPLGTVGAAQTGASGARQPVPVGPQVQPAGTPRPALATVPPPPTDDEATRPAPIPLRPRAAPGPAWIAMAAAAAVLLFVLGAFLGGPLGLAPAASPVESDPAVPLPIARSVDRILRQPDHRQVTLRTVTGEAAGSLLFDPASRELVVLTDRLPPAPDDGEYHCFVERSGERTWVGRMGSSNGFSYWAGPMDEPADVGRPGDRFVVVEEGADGPAVAPVLIGDL